MLSQLASTNQHPQCFKLVKDRVETALGGSTIEYGNVRQDRGQTHSYSGTLIHSKASGPYPEVEQDGAKPVKIGPAIA